MSDDGYDFEDDFQANMDIIEDEEEELEEVEDDEYETSMEVTAWKPQDDRNTLLKNLDKKERITVPFLTKYERTRIVGIRAQQIARGAPLYVDREDEIDPIVIAEKELYERKLPFIIRRVMPDGIVEDWRVKDLQILDDDRPRRALGQSYSAY